MATEGYPSENKLEGVQGREATPEEIARRDAYRQGRSDANYAQNQLRNQEQAAAYAREESSAASGVVVGLLIALLAGAVGVALYFLTGSRSNPVPATAPTIERESVIERETTVIERDNPAPDVSLPDVQVEVPEVSVPDVNVNVPEVNAPDVSLPGSQGAQSDSSAGMSAEPDATEPAAEAPPAQ